MRPAVDDTLRDLAAEAALEPILGLNETPRDVVAALLEAYRQQTQDVIYADWGESFPETAAQEAQALQELHARCEGWWARNEAAVDRMAQRTRAH